MSGVLDLYDALCKASKASEEHLPEGWPKSARAMGKRLKTIQATLADIGISVSWARSSNGNARSITLDAVRGCEPMPETPETAGINTGAEYASAVSPSFANSGPAWNVGAGPPSGAASDITGVSVVWLLNSAQAPCWRSGAPFGTYPCSGQAPPCGLARAPFETSTFALGG